MVYARRLVVRKDPRQPPVAHEKSFFWEVLVIRNHSFWHQNCHRIVFEKNDYSCATGDVDPCPCIFTTRLCQPESADYGWRSLVVKVHRQSFLTISFCTAYIITYAINDALNVTYKIHIQEVNPIKWVIDLGFDANVLKCCMLASFRDQS